ncbi:hypothetical protein SUGI_0703950 [Cryptomeria japonica]|uniref:probable receptor-like protein kinase At5g20050 n=1 Tax=Cryptomeria japonica TaxID=3369 RepID=UPI0024147189|nr:probable receptor-like protein kinase At5g20050 [Cryptomeria japonica]GLJ34976.1 hypothetical protein SUGI_0703950 [Cryptomeria japonica]
MNHKHLYAALAAALAATVIILIVLLIFIRCRYKKKFFHRSRDLANEGQQMRLEYSFFNKVAGLPKKFTYKEIESATDNFKILLGRGASASVFKGVFEDGTEIAVKRMNKSDHGRKEFEAEVAAIANVNHINLVRLIGFCTDGPHRILVYELVSNGSLGSWIFGARREHPLVLGWAQRFRIVVGVAKALSYLHHDCRARILHLDVKPENILLDGMFEAKVSDFGLSRLMGRDESRVMTTMRGTKGYLAPEWLLSQGITMKSDVYGFGMVVFEVIGGRRNVSQINGGENSASWTYFPSVVMKKAKEGKLMEIVDRRLDLCSVDERQLVLLIKVAIWCIQEKSRLRPAMDKVVDMLEGRCEVLDPPETKMIIVDLLNLDDDLYRQNDTRSVGPAIEEGTDQNGRIINFRDLSYSYTMSVVSGR